MEGIDLTKGSIPKHIAHIAIPASVGFLFNTLYNVIDTYWGGQVSTEALAALSLSFPIFFIIIALGTGIGTGATALIANALGKNDKEKARQYAAQSISFSFLLSIILTIVGLWVSPYLFMTLGASGEYLHIAVEYMNVILYGTVFFMMSYALNAILNAQGDTKSFRNFLIGGAVVNMALDPIFMYGFGLMPAMGFKGIALATILIQFAGMIYLVFQVKKANVFSSNYFQKMIPNAQIYKEISEQGFPAGLNMMMTALGIFIITYFLSKFTQNAVAAYGIATRIEQIVLMPTIGLNIAALSIISQNNGAGYFERIKEALSKTMKYGLIILTIGYALVFIFANQMMGWFTSDIDVITTGAFYLRIAFFISWAYVLLFQNVSALQGLKKPMFALWMGIYRQIVAPLIIFPICIAFLGLNGVWLGIFLTVWTGALYTVYYTRKKFQALG